MFPFQALLPLRKGLRELLVPGSLAEQSVASDILTFVDARLATSGVLHPLPAPRDYQKGCKLIWPSSSSFFSFARVHVHTHVYERGHLPLTHSPPFVFIYLYPLTCAGFYARSCFRFEMGEVGRAVDLYF